ncbi:MAG: hypothetical protein LBI02_04170 [Opitutaceae bacterium]|nr:hypothetical protein [Opitutaceae bacterium]
MKFKSPSPPDGGSGAASLLGLAEKLASLPPPRNLGYCESRVGKQVSCIRSGCDA